MPITLETMLKQRSTVLGRIAVAPSRLMTVSEWWEEMDEPISMLEDPVAAIADDEQRLLRLCTGHGIWFRPRRGEQAAAYPAWLFLAAFPTNP